MKIPKKKPGDFVTICLGKKLDTTGAKAFEENFLPQIEWGNRRFIIDLAQLEYIGSAGLRVFAVASKRLNGVNDKIVLCGFKKTVPYHTLNRPSDPIREVFDIAGFSSLFATYGSEVEAIKGLQT